MRLEGPVMLCLFLLFFFFFFGGGGAGWFVYKGVKGVRVPRRFLRSRCFCEDSGLPRKIAMAFWEQRGPRRNGQAPGFPAAEP